MKAGLKRTYDQLTQDTIDAVSDKYSSWLPLMFAIAFVHSSIIERKKYGPLGWCIKYEFGTHDFNASLQFLQNYLLTLSGRSISYETICYMISEVHYGGRITDDCDRKLMITYTKEWVNPNVLGTGFFFDVKMPDRDKDSKERMPIGKYTTPYHAPFQVQGQQQPIIPIAYLSQPVANNPQFFTLQFIRDYIKNQIPGIDNPTIFRMHPNAEITYRL